MLTHLRGALWLLALTVLVCCVLYPLSLWLVGRVPGLSDQADGSLVTDRDGNVVGSRLIAQNFEGDEFFQPRPSHAGKGYEADKSGASNWGGSNYLLRDRVARQLGPIVRYGKDASRFGKHPGAEVGPDVEVWFQQDHYEGQPGIVAQWATLHPGLAEEWVKKTGAAVKAAWQKQTPAEAFAQQWRQDFPELYARWRQDNASLTEPTTADLAKGFFAVFSAAHPGRWPFLAEDAEKRKRLVPVKQAGEGSEKQNEIQSVFFDLWRQAHPDIDLEPVPADLVTASGSGLDPHITLANALYQAPRVARARAKLLTKDEARARELEVKIRRHLEETLPRHSAAPLFGLAGVPLVNVLEVNLALPDWVREAVR